MYHPYGAVRHSEGILPTDFTFTNQQADGSTGLMYYRARYYDPGLGRFISADTAVPEMGNPQALNRYAYVYNNPLRHTDPSGHQPDHRGRRNKQPPPPLDVTVLWDPDYIASVNARDRQAAEQAFLRFLNDPQYFAALYTDPAAWRASEEVVHLEVFAQYSLFHTTAEGLVLACFSPDVAGDLWAAHLHSALGNESGAAYLLAAVGVGVYRGGAYRSVRGAPGLEAHHLLADSVSPIPYMDGPAIQMEPVDHMKTGSWGPRAANAAWRQQQGDLIRAGRMRDALAMAIKDIRSKFGSKYNSAIQEAIQYARSAGFIDKNR